MRSSLPGDPRSVAPPGCHLGRRERTPLFQLKFGGHQNKKVALQESLRRHNGNRSICRLSKNAVLLPLHFKTFAPDDLRLLPSISRGAIIISVHRPARLRSLRLFAMDKQYHFAKVNMLGALEILLCFFEQTRSAKQVSFYRDQFFFRRPTALNAAKADPRSITVPGTGTGAVIPYCWGTRP